MAFPKLIGVETLKFNTLITSDQESPLISGVRSLMGSSDICTGNFPLKRSRHRFDMYHIFIKEWKNEVCIKFGIYMLLLLVLSLNSCL